MPFASASRRWRATRAVRSELARLKECVEYQKVVYSTARYMYMGWLRLVGSLKLQVAFEEYPLCYRALLIKRPVILRSLLIEAESRVFDCTVYLYGVAPRTHRGGERERGREGEMKGERVCVPMLEEARCVPSV